MLDAVTVPDVQIATGKAVRGEWDDPNDTGRRGTGVRMIVGYRRADTILMMHRRSPTEITIRHAQAAERLRDDYEIGEGVNTGGRAGGGEIGPTDAMLDARARFADARRHVGPTLWRVLAPIVLDGWSIKDWAAYHGWAEGKAAGMLIAALGCLYDHYNPAVANRA